MWEPTVFSWYSRVQTVSCWQQALTHNYDRFDRKIFPNLLQDMVNDNIEKYHIEELDNIKSNAVGFNNHKKFRTKSLNEDKTDGYFVDDDGIQYSVHPRFHILEHLLIKK